MLGGALALAMAAALALAVAGDAAASAAAADAVPDDAVSFEHPTHVEAKRRAAPDRTASTLDRMAGAVARFRRRPQHGRHCTSGGGGGGAAGGGGGVGGAGGGVALTIFWVHSAM